MPLANDVVSCNSAVWQWINGDIPTANADASAVIGNGDRIRSLCAYGNAIGSLLGAPKIAGRTSGCAKHGRLPRTECAVPGNNAVGQRLRRDSGATHIAALIDVSDCN